MEYIIFSTNYLTKWAKAKATTRNDACTTANFLCEQIFTRFGLPSKNVSDIGVHFVNEIIEFMMSEFLISHKKSPISKWSSKKHQQNTLHNFNKSGK